MPKRIPIERIRHHSGWHVSSWGSTKILRDGYYQVLPHSITGEAPKEFIRVYSYGTGTRRNQKTWPSFIAKVGHKSYPTESITEQLISRIGQLMGLNMADSCLALAHGQLRFMSRYFLNQDQSLVHGAQVLGAYMEDDRFVRDVETVFPNDHQRLLASFVDMLAFDAIVGNNDRHHYNWGVVVHARESHKPYFSPIYDSARALFWNELEQKVVSLQASPARRADILRSYIEKSRPQTGWDGVTGLDNFRLSKLTDRNLPDRVRDLMDNEFQGLLSRPRMSLIAECIELRLEHFSDSLVH